MRPERARQVENQPATGLHVPLRVDEHGNVGTAKPVDALFGVAHHEQPAVLTIPQAG